MNRECRCLLSVVEFTIRSLECGIFLVGDGKRDWNHIDNNLIYLVHGGLILNYVQSVLWILNC